MGFYHWIPLNGALLYMTITNIDYAIANAPEFDAPLLPFQPPLVETIQYESHLKLLGSHVSLH